MRPTSPPPSPPCSPATSAPSWLRVPPFEPLSVLHAGLRLCDPGAVRQWLCPYAADPGWLCVVASAVELSIAPGMEELDRALVSGRTRLVDVDLAVVRVPPPPRWRG